MSDLIAALGCLSMDLMKFNSETHADKLIMRALGKKIKIVIVLMVLSLWGMGAGSAVLAEDIFVITSKKVPIKTIDPKTIQAIFLGKKSIWPDGKPIEFVILDSGDTHSSFLKAYIKKTPSRFKRYWKKQVFTGKGFFPKLFASEQKLIEYIAEQDGAIGYVSNSIDIKNVKIVSKK